MTGGKGTVRARKRTGTEHLVGAKHCSMRFAFDPTKILEGRCSYQSHFRDMKAEAQRG